MSEQVTPLVPYDMYRTHAVHIGTNQKSADMQRFLDTDARDGSGLHLIDIERPTIESGRLRPSSTDTKPRGSS